VTERATGRISTEAAQHCIEPQCQATYALSEMVYVCRRCGGLLEARGPEIEREYARRLPGVWEARLASMDPRDRSGVWRYRELLPFAEDAPIVTLAEGNTPLYDAPRAAAYCRLDSLLLKHQGLNPTSSFKDTGMTTAVTQAGILGARALVCASTGNTAASLAAYAARARLQCAILVPRGQVSFAKLAQSLDYGAVVLEIEGNFDVAMALVRELGEDAAVYLVNSINPFRIEGQKTVAVELLEQCQWRVPDHVVVPGGNLGNSSALGKGFLELFDLGIIERLPRLSVVQAEGAAPFTHLFAQLTAERTATDHSESDRLQPIDDPHTLATAIKIGAPVSWKKSLRAVLRTGGQVLSVSEQEIADAKAIIGRDGIGCEPASATTVAGIKRLVGAGKIGDREMVVAVLTGHLLKDTDYVINYHNGTLHFQHAGKEETIASRFGNRAVRVKATKDAILEQLRRAGDQDLFGGRRDS
jgi:threonine synthase